MGINNALGMGGGTLLTSLVTAGAVWGPGLIGSFQEKVEDHSAESALLLDRLNNFATYIYPANSKNPDILCGVSDITLPTLTPALTEAAGAGIGGALNLPNIGRWEDLTMTINFRTPNRRMFTAFSSWNGFRVECRGAIQATKMEWLARKVPGWVNMAVKLGVLALNNYGFQKMDSAWGQFIGTRSISLLQFLPREFGVASDSTFNYIMKLNVSATGTLVECNLGKFAVGQTCDTSITLSLNSLLVSSSLDGVLIPLIKINKCPIVYELFGENMMLSAAEREALLESQIKASELTGNESTAFTY